MAQKLRNYGDLLVTLVRISKISVNPRVNPRQFIGMDWTAFIRAHNFEHSMSRRGNCHDNAVAESFFSSLKRERVRRRTCYPPSSNGSRF